MKSVYGLLVWLLLLPVTTSATEPPIIDLAFAPDGKSIVACSQTGLQVYSWPGRKRERLIHCDFANLHAVRFSPDGKHVAVGGGEPSELGVIEIFTWPVGNKVRRLAEHDDSVRSLAWIDNSRLVSASVDRTIKLWGLKEDKSIGTLEGHSRSVNAICVLSDGKTIVSSGTDQSVRVWSIESGKLARSLSQHTMPVYALALCPKNDGLPLVASASADRTIRFWQPTIGRMVRYIRLDFEPLDIAWINESLLAASCADGQVRVINSTEVTVAQTLPGIKGWAYAIAANPIDAGVAVAGSDGQVCRLVLRNASHPDNGEVHSEIKRAQSR